MKKNMYIIILLLIMIFPISVYAEGSVSLDTESITVEQGSTKTFSISTYNVTGDITITSADEEIATVNKEFFQFGNFGFEEDTKQKLTHTITVTGEKVGETTITVVIEGATFDVEKIAETETIAVKVVEKTGYTVKYDANGGKEAPVEGKKEKDVNLNLATAKPTYEGHTFTGWNTKVDGSGKTYQPGSVYSENADVTLYAQWKQTGNVKDNPQTGDTLIYVVLLLTLGALIYSYWYMKKTQEN